MPHHLQGAYTYSERDMSRAGLVECGRVFSKGIAVEIYVFRLSGDRLRRRLIGNTLSGIAMRIENTTVAIMSQWTMAVKVSALGS